MGNDLAWISSTAANWLLSPKALGVIHKFALFCSLLPD